jgi:hypothetical protein
VDSRGLGGVLGAVVKARALEALTHRLEQPAAGDGGGGCESLGVLVEILAYEGDTEQAWQVATDYGCKRQPLLTLGRAREDAHPLDVIGVYEPEVFALIEAEHNAAYREAVNLLGCVTRPACRAGTLR